MRVDSLLGNRSKSELPEEATSETAEPSAAERQALREAPLVVLGAPEPSATPTPGIITLRVEEMLRAPPALAGLEGQTIRVQPDESQPEFAGAAIVLAEGISYGETVTVREVGRLPTDVAGQVRTELQEDARAKWIERLRERALGASTIVVGQVEELKRHPAGQAARSRPASEHDPDWWVATLFVRDVVGGRPRMTRRRMEVAFPNSDDIMWAHAPKPRPGQEAVFLLRRERVRDLRATVYTALDPWDVRPLEEREFIADLAKGRG
jgi:hypothetical protein